VELSHCKKDSQSVVNLVLEGRSFIQLLLDELRRDELVRDLDPRRVERSKQCISNYVGLTKNHVVIFKTIHTNGSRRTHYQSVKLLDLDIAKGMDDLKIRDKVRLALAGDLELDCSCEDFSYRYRYQATQLDYSLVPEDRPSFVTNPNFDKGTFCKHMINVIRVLPANQMEIVSDYIKRFGNK